MEPNYKEIADDLRFQYNRFLELWQKAKDKGLDVLLTADPHKDYINSLTDPKATTLHITYKERF